MPVPNRTRLSSSGVNPTGSQLGLWSRTTLLSQDGGAAAAGMDSTNSAKRAVAAPQRTLFQKDMLIVHLTGSALNAGRQVRVDAVVDHHLLSYESLRTSTQG